MPQCHSQTKELPVYKNSREGDEGGGSGDRRGRDGERRFIFHWCIEVRREGGVGEGRAT